MSIQLHTPAGFGPLKKGERYFLLDNGACCGRVLLVSFGAQPSYCLATIAIEDFERACKAIRNARGTVRDALIERVPEQDRWDLPPWLRDRRGLNGSIASLRAAKLTDALDVLSDITSADNPDKVLNGYAYGVKENTQRFRLWFYTYVAFGFNAIALPPGLAT
ncbi:hypothetical protein WG922_16030 [Ramlibacter sp. AN1015]|uniref:hypothetical protein n=1 Tax=Ramlibacter sp. AN1015 TaxID=3133428 RepID=UPI0030C16ED5